MANTTGAGAFSELRLRATALRPPFDVGCASFDGGCDCASNWLCSSTEGKSGTKLQLVRFSYASPEHGIAPCALSEVTWPSEPVWLRKTSLPCSRFASLACCDARSGTGAGCAFAAIAAGVAPAVALPAACAGSNFTRMFREHSTNPLASLSWTAKENGRGALATV